MRVYIHWPRPFLPNVTGIKSTQLRASALRFVLDPGFTGSAGSCRRLSISFPGPHVVCAKGTETRHLLVLQAD